MSRHFRRRRPGHCPAYGAVHGPRALHLWQACRVARDMLRLWRPKAIIKTKGSWKHDAAAFKHYRDHHEDYAEQLGEAMS